MWIECLPQFINLRVTRGTSTEFSLVHVLNCGQVVLIIVSYPESPFMEPDRTCATWGFRIRVVAQPRLAAKLGPGGRIS